jgi:mannose-1-phosphate guanylyltransferase
LALSAAFIAERYSGEGFEPKDISVAVLTADQSIEPNEGFVKTIDFILNYVENNPFLATIGIQPNRPETGYGYIQVNEPFDKNNIETEIKPIIRFVEKPDVATAEKYLESGKFLWNSGMFFWRLDNFIQAMKIHLPEVGEKISEIQKNYHKKTQFALPEALDRITPIFEKFPNISIDYGIMEKVNNAVVAKALFNWDDIGSWDSLDRIKHRDEHGNIIEGVTAIFETKDSVIINASSNSKTVVAGFGFENMVIVVTDDAVLFCPKDRVQEVKKCVEILRKNNGEKWL